MTNEKDTALGSSAAAGSAGEETTEAHVEAPVYAAFKRYVGIDPNERPDDYRMFATGYLAAAPTAPTLTEASRSETGRGAIGEWDGATLETRLRSYPAAPPGSDAMSCAYVSALMTEAADALTARPVVEDALRLALKEAVSNALYKNQFEDDWRELVDPVVDAVTALTARPVGEDALREALGDAGPKMTNPNADAPPSEEAMRAAVELEILNAIGTVTTQAIGRLIDQAIAALAKPTQPAAGQGAGDDFPVGTLVEKTSGEYDFPGTVVASFAKLAGQRRYVVEDDRRSLHIFSAVNLRVRLTTPAPKSDTGEAHRG